MLPEDLDPKKPFDALGTLYSSFKIQDSESQQAVMGSTLLRFYFKIWNY